MVKFRGRNNIGKSCPTYWYLLLIRLPFSLYSLIPADADLFPSFTHIFASFAHFIPLFAHIFRSLTNIFPSFASAPMENGLCHTIRSSCFPLVKSTHRSERINEWTNYDHRKFNFCKENALVYLAGLALIPERIKLSFSFVRTYKRHVM